MFLGAGSAATGIADLICYALQQVGLTEIEARQRLWFVDVEGLLVKGYCYTTSRICIVTNDPGLLMRLMKSSHMY